MISTSITITHTYMQNYQEQSLELREQSSFIFSDKPDASLISNFKTMALDPRLDYSLTSQRLDKAVVHKKSQNNVLLSNAMKLDQTWYFFMFTDNDEFIIDHPSDHVQGILLMEAARQAGIATTHLEGLPEGGIITLNNFNMDFFHFVTDRAPIVIRSISRPVVTRNGKFSQYVIINIMQNDKVCASAIVQGTAFDSTTTMERYMNLLNKRSEKKQ